jgi:malate dehydrogenase (oxaloacetate-decarboxylating)
VRYRDRLCTFNDDIQGTGAVTLAGLLTAVRAIGARLRDERVVILGAGSSAIGISDQIVAAMRSEGLTEAEARGAIWLVDSEGVVHANRPNLSPSKLPYAKPASRIAEWAADRGGQIGLLDVVRNVKPGILIGTSAQPGAFTEEAVRAMAAGAARPIVFPLSNPTSKSEAVPADLLRWTDGRALVATGSPFPDVVHNGQTIRIGQCNNAFVFPGIGLGVIASGATRVTDTMFVAAARALSAESPVDTVSRDGLYPRLERAREIALHVAVAVGEEAQQNGVAPGTSKRALEERIRRAMWTPVYPTLRRPQ